MSERADLLDSIAETVADYREGEIERPTSAHVDRWVSQFTSDVQVPILKELDHVLKRTYISRSAMVSTIQAHLTNERLVGVDPRQFWKGASLLSIQQHGHSQADMLKLLGDDLDTRFGLRLDECKGTRGVYLYLDDVLFTGRRIGNDLSAWIEADAPPMAEVHIVVHSSHTVGKWDCERRLTRSGSIAGKRIDIRFWETASIESRFKDRASPLLRPTETYAEPHLREYLSLPHKFPFEPRKAGGPLGPFSSEAGRQLLERELLMAGVRIRANCANPKDIVRPLGFSQYGLGFGSMIVTYRNCPNNTPLAMWWGVPGSGHADRWYPLFPRKTYTETAGFDVLPF